jgi:integrase
VKRTGQEAVAIVWPVQDPKTIAVASDLGQDLLDYVVAVDNQRSERQGTKNGTVRRSRIGADVVALLKAYKASQRARQLRSRTWKSTDLVVVSRNGQAPRPRSLSQGWQRIAEKAGVEARFHDLRHTHATGLLRAGVDVTEVARSVGHANPTTTLRVYSHVLDELEPGSNVDFMAGLKSKREA